MTRPSRDTGDSAPAAVDEGASVDDIPASVSTGLTEAQLEAVTAPERVVCVLAGAGTGKTRVLTLRVARRVHDGSASGNRILVCTFSRKAADELRRRLWALDVGGEVRAGTIHRTALHILRQHRLDRALSPPRLLIDRRATLASLLGTGTAATGGRTSSGGVGRSRASHTSGARRSGAAQLETEIGWAKARMLAPDEYEGAARAGRRRTALGAARVAELYGRYEATRRRQGLIDLDDLLWSCAELLEEDSGRMAAVRWQFRHLFVDEMQDVNPAQYRLLRAIGGDEPDLFVVGDPYQSVYGWNGADPTLLDQLPIRYPGARVVRLDENHRSSPQVVAVAAAALGVSGAAAPRSTRPDGPVPRLVELETDGDEATWVARQAWFAHRPGRRWSQIAVLARTNAQLASVADALAGARVPFRLAGGDVGPGSDVRSPTADDQQDEQVDRSRPVGDDEDGVVLTTFHRAKGLQWSAVFVIGLADGLVPLGSARSAVARDEERRLLYVALTRAEEEVMCSWAAFGDSRDGGGAPRRPSPWLADMHRARAVLEAAAAPPDPSLAASHLAAIRARLDGPRS